MTFILDWYRKRIARYELLALWNGIVYHSYFSMVRVSGNRNFVVIQGNVTKDIVIDGDGNTLTLRAEESGGAVNFKTSGVGKKEKNETITKLQDKRDSGRVIKTKTADEKRGCCCANGCTLSEEEEVRRTIEELVRYILSRFLSVAVNTVFTACCRANGGGLDETDGASGILPVKPVTSSLSAIFSDCGNHIASDYYGLIIESCPRPNGCATEEIPSQRNYPPNLLHQISALSVE